MRIPEVDSNTPGSRADRRRAKADTKRRRVLEKELQDAPGRRLMRFIESRGGTVVFGSAVRAELLKRHGIRADQLILALTKLGQRGLVALSNSHGTLTAVSSTKGATA